MRDIPCFSYERPPWAAQPGDAWREFASWQDMVDAIPAGCRVCLAGGTASIEAFRARDDIHLWARALNVSAYNDTVKHRFLNAMPNQDMNAEADLFSKYDIELFVLQERRWPCQHRQNRGGAFAWHTNLAFGAGKERKQRAS